MEKVSIQLAAVVVMEKSFRCIVFELALVLFASLCYAGKVGVSVFAWWGNHTHIRLLESLPDTLARYHLPISPSSWAHALWLGIYASEAVSLLMAWVSVWRRHTPHLVFPGYYLCYSIACLLHVGAVFAWGLLLPQVTLPLLVLLTLVLGACVAMVTGYLYSIRSVLKFYYTCNFRLTRIFVVNGGVAYTTFSLVFTLLNMAVVLVRSADVAEETAATIALSLLGAIVVTYFLLENTILDPFLRYVGVVYPVVLWSLAAVLTQTWQGRASLDDRNQLFVLVLACVVGALALVRVVLWLFFLCLRPLQDYERDELESLPQ